MIAPELVAARAVSEAVLADCRKKKSREHGGPVLMDHRQWR
jgi:hypothetical protein